jgi:hypothetical protein
MCFRLCSKPVGDRIISWFPHEIVAVQTRSEQSSYFPQTIEVRDQYSRNISREPVTKLSPYRRGKLSYSWW